MILKTKLIFVTGTKTPAGAVTRVRPHRRLRRGGSTLAPARIAEVPGTEINWCSKATKFTKTALINN